jgi:hypothetical protein
VPTAPGYKIWENTVPVTTGASPLVSPWFDTTGYTTILPYFAFVSGTTVFTVEGSFDGATMDSTLAAYSAPASGTAMNVQHTFIRFRVVQTVANATVTTIFVQARA